MKKLLLLLLLSSPCLAGGPKYRYSDAKLDDEINNLYHDIESVLKGDVRISSVTIGTATIQAIRGSTAGDSASAGNVGEYQFSYIDTATNYPSTGNWGDLTSISLTAGDWDISALVESNPGGATVTTVGIGISTTTGNSTAGLLVGNTQLDALGPTSVSNVSLSIPSVRLSINTTMTAYLKYMASYSVSTPQARGRISARRVR